MLFSNRVEQIHPIRNRSRGGSTALALVLALTAISSACYGDRGVAPAPSQAIGWLSRGGETGPCQAVAIAPDRLLTVAHCVADPGSWQPPPAGDLQVLTAERSFEVLDAALPSARSIEPLGAIVDLAQDWAILRVATDGGTFRAFPRFGGQRAASLAFSFDEPVVKAAVVTVDGRHELRTASCLISTLDVRQHLLTYRCGEGTGPGLSGSPLLVESERGYELIGVMSGRQRLPSGDEVGVVVMPPDEAVEAAIGRD